MFAVYLSTQVLKMKQFVVYSGIPRKELDVVACIGGIPRALKKAGIENVHLTNCSCCSPPESKKVIMEFQAPDQESLSAALKKVDFPVESIHEVTTMKRVW